MDIQKIVQLPGFRHLVAVALVGVAAALRIWPLQLSDTTLPWLTFYPAVMAAALYGGLWPGLLATALSCIAATLLHPPLAGTVGIWQDLTAFVATSGMLCIAAEAMHRAQAREQGYSALFESMDEGFCVVEMIYDRDNKPVDYRFVQINPAFEKQTGFTQGLGKTIRELVPDHDEHWFDIYGKVASTGVPVRFENPAVAMQRYYDVFAFRVGGDDSRRVGILFKDISAQKQSEALLIVAREQAVTANRAKSVFLATMSHELRTPLNAILGFSALMRGDPEISERQRDNLDIINRSGEHLLNLINDVLDMAKIEAGQTSLKQEAFDLGALLRDITDMLEKRADEKGLRLHLDQSSSFPRFISADAAKLRQMLINLVGNAIKFTEHGSVILRLNARPDDERVMLDIEVQDSGSGIAAEDLARIFDPFVQVGREASQKGTGLGLAITREFAELMGGKISVRSAPGQGSTFRIEIPVERAESAPLQTGEAEQKRPTGMLPGQPEYRILIVEDQKDNWLLLQRLMESVKIEVHVAQNGAEGIAEFISWRPDLIWMDIRMPVMNGLEATQRIRALEGGRDVKIVALTASVSEAEREQVMTAGMDDFVRKPYRPEELFACMTRLLGIRFMYQEAPPDRPDAQPLPKLLANLPDGMRRNLGDALTSLDPALIAQVIGEISAQDPALGEALMHHAERLDYTAILRALKTKKEPP